MVIKYYTRAESENFGNFPGDTINVRLAHPMATCRPEGADCRQGWLQNTHFLILVFLRQDLAI
jgi:hypothetical protein